MSKILNAALDPSCLMCYTPLGWHSPLRQGVVWPGSPRNFASAPAAWRDFNVISPSGDFRFAIDFTMASKTPGTILGNPSGSPQIHIYAGSINIQVTIRLFDSAVTYVYINNYEINRQYHVEITRAGNVATISGDVSGSQVGVVPTALSAVLESTHNGTITNAEMRDSNKIVWSYPSISERLRLITNTNVINTGTHWEAANPAIAARIDTALDLRGAVSSYTVAVDFEAADFGGLSSRKQELAGQGPALATGGFLPICALTYGGNPGGFLQIAQEIAGARVAMLRNIFILTGRHVATGVVSVNQATNQTTLSIYLDGVLVGATGVYAGLPTGAATQPNFAVNDNRSGTFTNFFGKIYAAVLFNKALPAGQIAYLSN